MIARAALPGLLLALALAWLAPSSASASPWAEVGDTVLRADIETLAANRVVDALTSTWPIPWRQIAERIKTVDAATLPAHVRRSLERVRARLARETETGRLKSKFTARLAGDPSLLRDFGTGARNEFDVRASGEYMFGSTALRLSVGGQSDFDFADPDFSFDDSYAAQVFGNWMIYGGVLDSWWGPGTVSSLIMSNNARPFPRIGLMRNNPVAFETPWLSWIGPWQFNAFVGVLDDNGRAVEDPILAGFRLAINPLPGLELGANRVTMVCGRGISCNSNSLQSAFLLADDNFDPENISNGIGGADASYTTALLGYETSLYGQFIGEDLHGGFFAHISFLAGASIGGAAGADGGSWRLVLEHSDTQARYNNSLDGRNITYDHFIYQSGYRYRTRAIGHSLDSDSVVTSLVGTLTDVRDWTYRLAYHNISINRDGTTLHLPSVVPVSLNKEDINLVEAGLTIPWRNLLFEVELRLQDDQPNTPGDDGLEAAIEAGWTVRF